MVKFGNKSSFNKVGNGLRRDLVYRQVSINSWTSKLCELGNEYKPGKIWQIGQLKSGCFLWPSGIRQMIHYYTDLIIGRWPNDNEDIDGSEMYLDQQGQIGLEMQKVLEDYGLQDN